MTADTDRTPPSADQWMARRVEPKRSRGAVTDSSAPRVPRRYGQWTASVLFVLVAVLAAGWLWQQKSDRHEVLSLAHSVPAGVVITRDDLAVVDVAGTSRRDPLSDENKIEGSTAAVGLVAGQILTPEMLTDHPLPAAGQRVVGVELDATRAPSGLVPGDLVQVLAAPPTGDTSSPDQLASPAVLAEQATVVSAARIEGAGTRLTLLVATDAAAKVASFGAAGRVTLIQLPLGGD